MRDEKKQEKGERIEDKPSNFIEVEDGDDTSAREFML